MLDYQKLFTTGLGVVHAMLEIVEHYCDSGFGSVGDDSFSPRLPIFHRAEIGHVILRRIPFASIRRHRRAKQDVASGIDCRARQVHVQQKETPRDKANESIEGNSKNACNDNNTCPLPECVGRGYIWNRRHYGNGRFSFSSVLVLLEANLAIVTQLPAPKSI